MTSHSIYGGIFITLLIKANVFLLPVKIKMRNWLYFMACVALPGWDVGWLIWETDKSSVTLSLCWVVSCSAMAVDFWVMEKVFLLRKRCGRRWPETPRNKSAVMAGFAVSSGITTWPHRCTTSPAGTYFCLSSLHLKLNYIHSVFLHTSLVF